MDVGPFSSTLHPYFVTGFSCSPLRGGGKAEGSFIIRVNKNSSYRTGWVVNAMFTICLHIEDLPLLLSIQEFFGGVGFITKDLKNNLAYFTVTKLDDITNVIIPFFNSYPLVSKNH